jgi:hypothetical protein
LFKPRGRVRAFNQSQFSGPVGKRQAQPFYIGMTGQELSFDFRDLAAAALDSCRLLVPLLRDLIEPPVVTIERGLLTA